MGEVRPAIVKQLGEKAKEKGLVVTPASEQWKGLSASAKAPHESKAAKLKAEYDKALEAFKAGGGEIVRKRKGDKNGKPLTAFFLYIEEMRPAIVKQLGERAKEKGLVVKTASDQWKGLAASAKAAHESKAAKLKIEYDK